MTNRYKGQGKKDVVLFYFDDLTLKDVKEKVDKLSKDPKYKNGEIFIDGDRKAVVYRVIDEASEPKPGIAANVFRNYINVKNEVNILERHYNYANTGGIVTEVDEQVMELDADTDKDTLKILMMLEYGRQSFIIAECLSREQKIRNKKDKNTVKKRKRKA